MPCNCIVDKPTYPQNEEWGPLIWLILHTLAEKAGRQTNAITMGDEQRAWPLFVKTLPQAIPCPYCRDHLQTYLHQTPFDLPMDYYEWKTYIPTYFYTLHESVNARLGKPSFPLSDLSTAYKDVGRIRNALAQLEKIQERAIKMGGVSLFHWRAWLKQLNMLRSAIL
jgi:hypothetical protein